MRNVPVEMELVDPCLLLTTKRFDVMAKYVYVRFKELGLETDWANQLYRAHIDVFNGYVEVDGSEKYGADSFVSAFDLVIKDISKNGFSGEKSTVPIDGNGTIFNGAHRLATCLYYKCPIKVERVGGGAPEYDYKFFVKRGFVSSFADFVASEYCRIEPNVFVPIIYPSARGRENEVRLILSKYGEIFYFKEVQLSGNGPLNLIRQIYHSESWLGSFEDGFSGAKDKAFCCFQAEGPVRVFVVKSNLENMLLAKNEIRDLFGINNHSVHINDTPREGVELSNILFNYNSIHFMNCSKMADFKWFYELISEYKNLIKKNNLDGDCLCVGGSAVMAAYGIREARDIDFLHHGYDDVDFGCREIGSHNHLADLYGRAVDDIVFNPRHHFYCGGVKFASLDVVKQMKVQRDEDKDKQDVIMIDAFLKGVAPQKSLASLMILLKPGYWYTKIRFMKLRARFYIFRLLKNLKGR